MCCPVLCCTYRMVFLCPCLACLPACLPLFLACFCIITDSFVNSSPAHPSRLLSGCFSVRPSGLSSVGYLCPSPSFLPILAFSVRPFFRPFPSVRPSVGCFRPSVRPFFLFVRRLIHRRLAIGIFFLSPSSLPSPLRYLLYGKKLKITKP